jgi:hypothetical protein
VPARFNVPAASDCHAGRPCSSLRVAVPAEEGTNHLLGSILGGLRHHQTAGPATTDTGGKAYLYTNRHPNCDHLAFVIRYTVIPQAGEIAGPRELTATAGNGSAVVYSCAGRVADTIMVCLFAPFAVADSGDQEATLTWTGCTIRDFSVFDVPRIELGSGDHRVEHVDSGHLRIGLTTERYIADSDEAGPPGLAQQIINAWDDYDPQVFSWWSEQPVTVASDSYTDPFGGAVFRHRARQKRASDTVTVSRWRIYAKVSTGTYAWRVRSSVGGDTVTSGDLSNTTAAWQTVLTGLDLSCVGDDQFLFECVRKSGAGTISIYGASGIEGAA